MVLRSPLRNPNVGFLGLRYSIYLGFKVAPAWVRKVWFRSLGLRGFGFWACGFRVKVLKPQRIHV